MGNFETANEKESSNGTNFEKEFMKNYKFNNKRMSQIDKHHIMNHKTIKLGENYTST